MSDTDSVKWYFKAPALIAAFLCAGPFVLPLVWWNPQYDKKKKIIITVAVLVVTYALWIMMAGSLKQIAEYYKQLSQF